jgi:Ser/Thr protein kinase RdoA (MazF antagonist)
MGDSLLNIGEAALFAVTGEKIKLHEYLGLRESLESRNPGSSMGDFSIDFNWETRSGCRIAKVEDISQDGSELEAIFKKGQSDKLRKERANIARWEELVPGAPPKVLEFSDGEEDAALLLEFLEGYTLRDLALNADRRVLDDAIGALAAVLRTVWETTRIETPVCAGFVSQALDRIEAVFQLHPEFVNACFEVGSLSVASLEELLERGKAAEQHLSAPFQTLLHGDLNLDNIIYNHRTRRVHLIDLYRSKESDYVQDIATLMISHFRLPVFETAVRNLLAHATVRIYEFAAGYASAHEDKTFDARLALGLARGFLTSTRFEMDATFAREMFARAVYLLEKIIRHDHEQFETFVLNKDIAIH